MSSQDSLCNGIAIVGMAGRFPGARTIDEFWENLTEGVDTTTFLTTEELLAAGVPSNVITSPNYVRAAFTLEDSDRFDADFFDFSPAEAEILDPQQRLFLQACWHALEDAGYPPAIHPQPFGVFGSTSVPSYQLVNLANHPLVANTRYGLDLSGMQVMFANAPDYLATRVSYKLNLCGPSVTVQTACSSSLVAVHQACQSLWGGECDLALAGGVSIKVPQRVGYFFEEGSIVSPDGRCRAFDEEAGGTVLEVDQFVAWAENRGFPIALVDRKTWLRRINEQAARDGHNLQSFSALLQMLVDYQGLHRFMQAKIRQPDMSNTSRGLAATDISCPPVTSDLLDTYLEHFLRTGFIADHSQAPRPRSSQPRGEQ